jgi:diguanylate cyclase (GGDEF)-like protein/PAS domain S-box-containing protein
MHPSCAGLCAVPDMLDGSCRKRRHFCSRYVPYRTDLLTPIGDSAALSKPYCSTRSSNPATEKLNAHARWFYPTYAIMNTESEISGNLPKQEGDVSVYEAAIHKSLAISKVALAHVSDGVMIADRDGRITHLNPVAESLTGWASADAIGRPMEDIFRVINGQTRHPAVNPARRAMAENRVVDLAADALLIQRDGSEIAIEDSAAPVLNDDGVAVGAVIVFHDERQSRERVLQMEHLAYHDLVTGLPNRALLLERMHRAIGLARRHRKQVGMLFIDLDNFKGVNDSLGHFAGDQLMQSIAAVLASSVRDSDTVSRSGGDEFLVLLSEIEGASDAAKVADKLLLALQSPHLLDGHSVPAAASIGISIFPDDGTTVEKLIRNADAAMYRAKAKGGTCYHFYGDHHGDAPKRQRRAADGDCTAVFHQAAISNA